MTLKVFDLLGREVATLVSEVLPAGTHEAHWIAEGNAGGVYLYELPSGGYEEGGQTVACPAPSG